MAVVGTDVGMAILVAGPRRVEDALLRHPDGDVAGIVGVVHVDQLYVLAAEMERQPVAEALDGVGRIETFERRRPLGKAPAPRGDLMGPQAGPLRRHTLVNDRRRRRGDERRTAGMVVVILG